VAGKGNGGCSPINSYTDTILESFPEEKERKEKSIPNKSMHAHLKRPQKRDSYNSSRSLVCSFSPIASRTLRRISS
jgi:hypothetical protein